MLNSKITKLLNEQVNKELFSAYLYIDIANYFTNHGLIGFTQWFSIQAKEEMEHAFKFLHYLQNNGADVVLDAIAKPTKTYPVVRDALVEGLKHEEFVTASIVTILEAAVEAHDYRTQEFLQWFIREQAEEEKNARDHILAFDMYGADKQSLFLLDKQVGKRGQE